MPLLDTRVSRGRRGDLPERGKRCDGLVEPFNRCLLHAAGCCQDCQPDPGSDLVWMLMSHAPCLPPSVGHICSPALFWVLEKLHSSSGPAAKPLVERLVHIAAVRLCCHDPVKLFPCTSHARRATAFLEASAGHADSQHDLLHTARWQRFASPAVSPANYIGCA